MTVLGQVAQMKGERGGRQVNGNPHSTYTKGDGATPSLTTTKTNLIMSRVSEAMSAIDEALRLGNITEEMATKLKNHPFETKSEFEELYNLAMSLNSASCNTVALEKFS